MPVLGLSWLLHSCSCYSWLTIVVPVHPRNAACLRRSAAAGSPAPVRTSGGVRRPVSRSLPFPSYSDSEVRAHPDARPAVATSRRTGRASAVVGSPSSRPRIDEVLLRRGAFLERRRNQVAPRAVRYDIVDAALNCRHGVPLLALEERITSGRPGCPRKRRGRSGAAAGRWREATWRATSTLAAVVADPPTPVQRRGGRLTGLPPVGERCLPTRRRPRPSAAVSTPSSCSGHTRRVGPAYQAFAAPRSSPAPVDRDSLQQTRETGPRTNPPRRSGLGRRFCTHFTSLRRAVVFGGLAAATVRRPTRRCAETARHRARAASPGSLRGGGAASQDDHPIRHAGSLTGTPRRPPRARGKP